MVNTILKIMAISTLILATKSSPTQGSMPQSNINHYSNNLCYIEQEGKSYQYNFCGNYNVSELKFTNSMNTTYFANLCNYSTHCNNTSICSYNNGKYNDLAKMNSQEYLYNYAIENGNLIFRIGKIVSKNRVVYDDTILSFVCNNAQPTIFDVLENTTSINIHINGIIGCPVFSGDRINSSINIMVGLIFYFLM